MKLVFLGTNGWFDTKIGSTVSILLDTKDHYFIFDAGYGIAAAGNYMTENKPAYLFISHFHMDHVCGLHTIERLKLKQPLTIFGNKDLKKAIKTLVAPPFMAKLESLSYSIKLTPLEEGNHKIPIKFTSRKLRHTVLTLGYRISVEDKIIAYCCDTGVCKNDILLAEKSDLLIHECSFLSGETSIWGHSNPEDAAGVAQRAGAKRLILTHFGADRYPTLASREEAGNLARKIFPATEVAVDGKVIVM